MCVRKDLAMGKGKIAAQCAHSALGAYRKVAKADEGTATYEFLIHTNYLIMLNNIKIGHSLR
jgi:peptidyl-tRNA hydrolase